AQYHVQLLRPPARLLAQGRDALFLLPRRACRTAPRTTTGLAQRREAPPAFIAPTPQVARRPRDPKLPAQAHHAFFPAHRPHDKSYPLIVHVDPVPRHLSRPPPPGRVL